MLIVSIYPNFANKGGAQDVALQLAERLNPYTKPIVLTKTPIDRIVSDYRSHINFLSFSWKNISMLSKKNAVFLSHDRKCTTQLQLLKLFFRKRIKVIHVAHNTFTNLRRFCCYPETVIAVSNGVKENLIEYFHVPISHIQVVFNGIKDCRNVKDKNNNENEIHILLAGRICPVKQQVELVKQSKGRIPPHVHIFFAGDGEDREKLQKEIDGDPQFHYIGFVKISECMNRYDYVCLFSQKEGLPLFLIEGLMFGKPLITNKLSVVYDVNIPNETGFAFSDFESLIQGLTFLPLPNSEEYLRLSLNARRRYEEFFTEEKMIKSYEMIINNLSSKL